MAVKTRNKLLIYTSAVIVFIVVIKVLAIRSKEKNKRDHLTNQVRSYSDEIESYMTSLQDIPDYIAFPLGNTAYRESDLKDMLRLIVENDEEIYGSSCAFEPYEFNKDSLYFAPYFYKHNNEISYKNLGNKEYDYFTWNWYLIPKRIGKAFWTEPYFDLGGGNINLITYSVPIYKYNDNSKKFVGVITVDMSLDWINKIVGSIKIENEGFALLVTRLGTVISTDIKNKNWRLRETIFSLAAEHKWRGFRSIGEKIISGQMGREYFTGSKGVKYIISYMPIKRSNWSLLIAVKAD